MSQPGIQPGNATEPPTKFGVKGCQAPDDEPASPLLAMDPNALQLVWAKCTFGAKAALACTCRELQQKSQAWQWGIVPSQQRRDVAFQWWQNHRKLAHWHEFVVQTPVSTERQGDYEAAEEVQAAWEPGEGKTIDDVLPDIGYDSVTCKAALPPREDFRRNTWLSLRPSTYMPMYMVISSPMLLYRLRCLFPSCEVAEWDGYKGVWHVSLRHKRTRYGAEFGEHKGAISISGDAALEEDEAATQDLLDLIELLCSDCCPHTYDGTVAGCVA